MKTKFSLLSAIALCCQLTFFSVSGAHAQTPRCTASLDRSFAEAGETLTYTVEISGPDAQMAGTPVLADVPGIELLSPNPGESTSVQIINGVKSESKSYHFIIRATGQGTIRIAAAEIPFKGRRLKTNTVSLSVGIPNKGKTNAADEIFFRAELSRDELYVGEQLIVTFKIFTRLSASNYNIVRLPNYIGFWAEELPVQQRNIEKVNIEGRVYRSEIIKRTAIFPAYPGELIINAAELDCEVNIPRNKNDAFSDPFQAFFSDPFGQTVVRRLSTPAVTVKVKELPDENRPRDFNGLVGQFDIRLQTDKHNLKTGEPVMCRITFTGTGNIMAAEIPNSPFPPDFEIFDPVSGYTIQREPTSIKGEKTIEWMAIPRKKGSFPIAPVSFSYYDPGLKKYITKQTSGFNFEVSQGKGGQTDTLITSVKPLHLAGMKEKIGEPGLIRRIIFSASGFWTLLAVPPLMLIGIIIWRFVKPVMAGIVKKNDVRNAGKTAGQNISGLIRSENDMPVKELYQKLHYELSNFLSLKTGVAAYSQSTDEYVRKLRDSAIQAGMADNAGKCLSRLEKARFSPECDLPGFRDDAKICLDFINDWERNSKQ